LLACPALAGLTHDQPDWVDVCHHSSPYQAG